MRDTFKESRVGETLTAKKRVKNNLKRQQLQRKFLNNQENAYTLRYSTTQPPRPFFIRIPGRTKKRKEKERTMKKM